MEIGLVVAIVVPIGVAAAGGLIEHFISFLDVNIQWADLFPPL